MLWKKLMKEVEVIDQLRDAIQEQERYRLVGLDRRVDALQTEVEVGLDIATLNLGKQPNWTRHYWAAALIPYLELTTRRPQWKWLSGWLGAIDGSFLDTTQVRIWANSVRRADRSPKYKAAKLGLRRHVNEQLGELHEQHRRDRVAASYGALNAAMWLKRTRSGVVDVDVYVRKAHQRMPFFSIVLPNASYLRKSVTEAITKRKHI